MLDKKILQQIREGKSYRGVDFFRCVNTGMAATIRPVFDGKFFVVGTYSDIVLTTGYWISAIGKRRIARHRTKSRSGSYVQTAYIFTDLMSAVRKFEKLNNQMIEKNVELKKEYDDAVKRSRSRKPDEAIVGLFDMIEYD